MQRLFGKKTRNNQDIIEQIILHNYNKYYRLAYSYVHNEADASDIVQNSAYKALRSCQTLNCPEYAESWVYRIVLNECFNFFRQPRADSYEEMEEGAGEQAYTEDQYEDIDLKRAIDGLEEQDKAIVILRFFEDMKLEEIAEILNENLNTVKSRLYRSIKKLRTVLADKQEQETEQNRKVGR